MEQVALPLASTLQQPSPIFLHSALQQAGVAGLVVVVAWSAAKRATEGEAGDHDECSEQFHMRTPGE